MFGWLKRLFGIASAEANAMMDKMEDPVKMTEQGIRDLKGDLTKSLQGLAEVKSLAIRAKKELEATQRTASEYENKAILLLQKAEAGELDAAEADRLAAQALSKKEQLETRVAGSIKSVQHYEQMVGKMEGNVQKLKQQIGEWENEMKTLKARHTVSQASERINKQLAQVDSSDTLARLERMKEKVTAQEALAESYADIANLETDVDREIDKALGPGSGSSNDALLKLKNKMADQQKIGSNESSSSAGEQAPPSGADAPTDGASPAGMDELEKLKQKLKDANN